MRFTIAAAAGAALLTLTACGGGGGGEGEANNQSAIQNELNAFNMMDSNETNGAIPDELEGNGPTDNRNLKTGEDRPADSNATAPAATTAPPAEDNGEVESNVSGM
jgi:hypothetical protein